MRVVGGLDTAVPILPGTVKDRYSVHGTRRKKFLELSCRKHLLEKRKNGNYSLEVVQGILILGIEGDPIPCVVA